MAFIEIGTRVSSWILSSDVILQPEINQISQRDICLWAQAEDRGIEWLKQKEPLGLSIKGGNRQSLGSNDLNQPKPP